MNKLLMVIPSVNGGDGLARMLPTLRFPPANVVVLDQGSSDDTAAVCAAHGVTLIQLGRPHTHAEACNIGASLARERGAGYVCVSKNDIIFRTPVLDEMLAEMERDPRLGIVAPSQLVADPSLDHQAISYRVSWHLDDIDFTHQTEIDDPASCRLEADFCELTCALVRMLAIDEIGFLDTEDGSHLADADFGFRLGRAGYSCAYLPRSQIVHFMNSAIDRETTSAKARSKLAFAQKHLGYGVNHRLTTPALGEDWLMFTQEVHGTFRRYGLLDDEGPEMITSYPGIETSGYLYTPFDGTTLPDAQARLRQRYQGIFTTSEAAKTTFRRHGVQNSFFVPAGIETDIFNPWSPVQRIFEETTYLAVIDGQQEQFLRVLLESWSGFSARTPHARLILFGRDLDGAATRPPDKRHRLGPVDIAHYGGERLDVYNALHPPSAQDLARLYRSVDYTIVRSRSDNPALAALQSLACETPCIQVHHGSETAQPGPDILGTGLMAAAPVAAVAGRLATVLDQTNAMSERDRKALALSGFYAIRGQFTLRHTAMGLHEALSHLQPRSPGKVISRLIRQQASAQTTEAAKVDLTPWTFRRRLGGLVARRIRAAGNLTSYFGQTWQERGFRAAGRGLQAEVTQIVARRVRRGSGTVAQPFPATGAPPDSAPPAAAGNSVLLIGYIDAQLGLGQSLRGLALAMSHTDLSFSIYPFGVGVEGRRSGSYMPERYDQTHAHPINVIEVATNELPRVFAHIGEAHFRGSYNVLRTYWELSRAPEAWRANLARIDEIWAPNPFIAESFRTIFSGPITVVPPCLDLPEVELDGHRLFGLSPHRFYFLFSFDYFSYPQRKNPLAVLRAFRKAFPDVSTPVGLVIKSTGAVDHFPVLKRALRTAADDDERIVIIDASLTRQEMLALLAAADCYTSLHRAEGFGLGLTEAMALGKPAIGTDYSGNTEFLTPETGFPIPYTLTPVGPDEYYHPEGQVWADPDEAACSAAMARVFHEPEEARARAAAGRRFVLDRYGAANVGRIVERRVGEIAALRAVTGNQSALACD